MKIEGTNLEFRDSYNITNIMCVFEFDYWAFVNDRENCKDHIITYDGLRLMDYLISGYTQKELTKKIDKHLKLKLSSLANRKIYLKILLERHKLLKQFLKTAISSDKPVRISV